MKPVLRALILAVSFAGCGWSADSAAAQTAQSDPLILPWADAWMTATYWQAAPIPSLLQVPTQDLEEPPEPGELSLLYLPNLDPLSGWDQDNAAWLKTEALALPSGIMPIIDWSLFRGACWIRIPSRGRWMLPASVLKKRGPVFSWLKSISVPSALRPSQFVQGDLN